MSDKCTGDNERRVYDKTDTFHWSKYLCQESVDRTFDHGDIIVALDPQERLGEGTYCVTIIDKGIRDCLRQSALFWQENEAFQYAESLSNGCTLHTDTEQ